MKVKLPYRLSMLCLCAALALPALSDSGNSYKNNMFNPVRTGVSSLSIAHDARTGAIGDVGAATEAAASSQYWNPAKYPFNLSRAVVPVSYTPW